MTRLAVKHMSASSSHAKRSGFTLLEVMIALAVFAITAIALLSQTNQSASQSLHLEEKAYALWIAENTLTELRLQPEWPPLGTEQNPVQMFDREWLVKTDISDTGETSLRRADVSVLRAGDNNTLASLLGYIGQY